MAIDVYGHFSPYFMELVLKGEICPHIVCGVDVYFNPNTLVANRVFDESKPCRFSDKMFWGSRHFKIFHLSDPENYDSLTDIPELRDRMEELGVGRFSALSFELLESNDDDTAYVLTSLDYVELKDLVGHEKAGNYFKIMGATQIPSYLRHLKLFHEEGVNVTSVSGNSLVGNLGDWKVSSHGGIISVETPHFFSGGIPLDTAIELNDREDPSGERKIMGDYIRVHGYAGGRDPRKEGLPNERDLRRMKLENASMGDIKEECSKRDFPLFIGRYHIDGSDAFRVWAEVAKRFIE